MAISISLNFEPALKILFIFKTFFTILCYKFKNTTIGNTSIHSYYKT